MYKILNTTILTMLLLLGSAVTGSAAWQITLDVSTTDPNADSGLATNRLTAGTDQTATDAYDNKFDTVALLRGPLQAYIVHPEYATEQQKLWRDLRSNTLPKEWSIEVNSPGEGNTVMIKWGINAPDNLSFTLIDQDNNQEIGIRESSEYSYNSISNSKKIFLLRVSENTTVTTGGNSEVNATKGGGCGHIKNIDGNNSLPGGNGSAVLNMAILFAPLIWLTRRKTLLSFITLLSNGIR
ncbi:MAG: hypothetical protein A2Z47_11065 [Thermodesulfovibrio sp. RBG_19FT_COMBO_42_12]|nr:MAG: hypothetical protein A2Z47_11065 [Thermodesulfovibrio sp. RBG_19FT_COMBO_42_12]